MGHSDNRLTQLNMLELAGTRPPTNVTERALLFDSINSTPKSNAPSKKRASAREGALDASTGTETALTRTVKSASSGLLHSEQRGNPRGRSTRRSTMLNSEAHRSGYSKCPSQPQTIMADRNTSITVLAGLVRHPFHLEEQPLCGCSWHITDGFYETHERTLVALLEAQSRSAGSLWFFCRARNSPCWCWSVLDVLMTGCRRRAQPHGPRPRYCARKVGLCESDDGEYLMVQMAIC